MTRSLPLLLIVLSLVTALTGCSRENAPEYDYTRVYIDGQGTLGIVERGATPKALVVYFHGLDADENVLIDDRHKEFIDRLLNSGYAVVASNARGNAFGNLESRHDYQELVRVGRSLYDVSKVYLVAESMGAIAAVDILAETNDPEIQRLVAISPFLDFRSAPPWGASAIDAAYPDDTMMQSNPIDLAPDRLTGKQLMFFASDGDTLVSTAENADAFRNRFGGVADVTVIPCTGEHVDPSCFQPEVVLKWLSQD
ncbi:alpha/beta hydrolase [Mycolicibacterium hodleri]|uniref:alpha/beta hydrolase n=1 Tax=Mycolicibacterium hodleri TaxID=49897 RepID=UPI001375BD95|nr:alpha/beta fold hydrolase [Mycolicibacterium hodleri]